MNSINREEMLHFKNLEEKDLDELHELLQQLTAASNNFFHPHDFDLETLHEIVRSKKDHYFVMILNRKIIGYSFLRLFDYEIPSFGCCIRYGYEGKGYGTILTKWSINKAKELGYKKVILKVYKENKTAFDIYKKTGFKIVAENKDKKEIKMEKTF